MGMSRRSPFWPTTVSIVVVDIVSGLRVYRRLFQSESVQPDDFFPRQLVGGAAAHDRQHIALLDELAHLAAESGGERTWTTTDARRATASYALGLALVRALPASHAVCLPRRGHPVAA